MDKYEELLLEEKYSIVEKQIKDKLETKRESSNLWYLLFLASNKNYIDFDVNNLKNEIALNKAIEYASYDEEISIKFDFNFYKDVPNIDGITKLFRLYQFKNYAKCLDLLHELSKNEYNDISFSDSFLDGIEHIFNNIDSIESLNIQLLILKFLQFIKKDKKISNLISIKLESPLMKYSKIDFDSIKTFNDITNINSLSDDKMNDTQKLFTILTNTFQYLNLNIKKIEEATKTIKDLEDKFKVLETNVNSIIEEKKSNKTVIKNSMLKELPYNISNSDLRALKNSAYKNNKESIKELANYYESHKDYYLASYWNRYGSKRNIASCSHNLARFYENGLYYRKNLHYAKYYYELSINQGDPVANNDLKRFVDVKAYDPNQNALAVVAVLMLIVFAFIPLVFFIQ